MSHWIVEWLYDINPNAGTEMNDYEWEKIIAGRDDQIRRLHEMANKQAEQLDELVASKLTISRVIEVDRKVCIDKQILGTETTPNGLIIRIAK